jgi:hypothetical protein
MVLAVEIGTSKVFDCRTTSPPTPNVPIPETV